MRFDGGLQIGFGGFQIAPLSAEKIDFSAGVKAGLVLIIGSRTGSISGGRAVALISTRGVERRAQAPCGHAFGCTGLANAGLGQFKIKIGGGRPFYQ